MATKKNKQLGKFLYYQRIRYKNLNKNYMLQDLINDRKYIKACMVKNKKKKAQQMLNHVKKQLVA